jgi:hypothetical protein
MKKICLILMVSITVTPLFAQQLASINAAPTWETPAFSWTMTTYDFGKIKMNSGANHDDVDQHDHLEHTAGDRRASARAAASSSAGHGSIRRARNSALRKLGPQYFERTRHKTT